MIAAVLVRFAYLAVSHAFAALCSGNSAISNVITPAPLATISDVEARTEQEFTSVERARVAVLCADATPPESLKGEAIGGHSRTLA